MEKKLSREQLVLPKLHYATVDPYSEGNWIERLGVQAFCVWLQLLTMVDRSTGMEKYNNLFTVPLSIAEVTKRLGYTKTTFRKNVLIPLWNYGLIDIVESDVKGKNGREVMNLVVYPYPFNDKELETVAFPEASPRNYATDYKSRAKTFGELGVVQREKQRILQYNQDLYEAEAAYYEAKQLQFTFCPQGSEIETFEQQVFWDDFQGTEIETFEQQGNTEHIESNFDVPNFNSGSNSEPIHINVYTKASNNLLSFYEDDDKNNIYNISDEEKNGKLEQQNLTTGDVMTHKQIKRLINDDMLLGYTYVTLMDFGFTSQDILTAIQILIDNQVTFTVKDVEDQLRKMANKVRYNEIIVDFGKFFAGGIILKAKNRVLVEKQDLQMKSLLVKQYEQNYGIPFIPNQENSVGFYNWLEN